MERDGGPRVWRFPSGQANGQARDRNGRVVFCSNRERAVCRVEHDGSISVLADRSRGGVSTRRTTSSSKATARSGSPIPSTASPTTTRESVRRRKSGRASTASTRTRRARPRVGRLRRAERHRLLAGRAAALCRRDGRPDEARPDAGAARLRRGRDGRTLQGMRDFARFAGLHRRHGDRRGRQRLVERRRRGALPVAGRQLLGRIRLPATVSTSASAARRISIACSSASATRSTRCSSTGAGALAVTGAAILRCASPAATSRRSGLLGDGVRSGRGRRGLRLGPQRLDLVPATEAGGAPPLSNETGFPALCDRGLGHGRGDGPPCRHDGLVADLRKRPRAPAGGLGRVTAFKFRDPEGTRWSSWSSRPTACRMPGPVARGPCLGIDHSAIAVAEAERSIDFYRRLGFRLASARSIAVPNRAPRRAGSDTVVEVVTLACRGGSRPHLELLCYQRPSAGGPSRTRRLTLRHGPRLRGARARGGRHRRPRRAPTLVRRRGRSAAKPD